MVGLDALQFTASVLKTRWAPLRAHTKYSGPAAGIERAENDTTVVETASEQSQRLHAMYVMAGCLRSHTEAEYDVDFHMLRAGGGRRAQNQQRRASFGRAGDAPCEHPGQRDGMRITSAALFSAHTLTPQTHGQRDGPNHGA